MSVGTVAAVLVLAILVAVAIWTLNRGSARQERLARRVRERQVRRLGRPSAGERAAGDHRADEQG